MSFQLLPDAAPFLWAFVVVGLLAMLTAVATVAVILVEHRGLRLARRESIPHYYRRLVLAH